MKIVNNASSRATAVALCVIALSGFVQSAFAQSSRIDGGTVSQSKFGFYWETRLEPGTPPLSGSFSTSTAYEQGIVHRLLIDSAQKMYVGYDVLVEPLSEPNTYRVTFRKLTVTPDLARQFLGDGWANIQTPGWGLPAPQVVKGGDVVSLPLLTSKKTNQRVVDYMTIQEPSQRFSGFNSIPERQFSYSGGPSRDFGLDDAELFIQSPRLSINGKLDETSARRFDEVSGAVVWLHVANRGRFLLSLVPHPKFGFRKAGEVRGSSLTFVIGVDTFTLNTGHRIAPGQAPYSLYVLHDPDWRPTYENADLSVFTMGAADLVESLLRK